MKDKIYYIVYQKCYGQDNWKECAVMNRYEDADERAMNFLKSNRTIESVKIVKATTTYEDIGEYKNEWREDY